MRSLVHSKRLSNLYPKMMCLFCNSRVGIHCTSLAIISCARLILPQEFRSTFLSLHITAHHIERATTYDDVRLFRGNLMVAADYVKHRGRKSTSVHRHDGQTSWIAEFHLRSIDCIEEGNPAAKNAVPFHVKIFSRSLLRSDHKPNINDAVLTGTNLDVEIEVPLWKVELRNIHIYRNKDYKDEDDVNSTDSASESGRKQCECVR